MADYHTQFSCILDVGSAENAIEAENVRQRVAAEVSLVEGNELGFDMTLDPETASGAIWIYSDGDGDPEHVIMFVLACAEAFDLERRWGFTWSLSSTRHLRVGFFGGGGQLLDLSARECLDWLDCAHWLELALAPESATEESAATTSADREP